MFDSFREEGRRECGQKHGHPRGFEGFGQRFAQFRGGRGEHGFFGRGFGGGPRERMFDGGELQLVILDQLATKPSYGYELIKSLEERLAGGYAPSPGVVYPTLTMLEEKGFATSETEAGKKVYTVTDAGREELKQNAERLREIYERLQHSTERFGRGRAPELMRAFGNLGSAVRAKMIRGNLTPEQLAKIAAAIDAAAKAVDAA